jgi:hypothetical protein
MDRERARTSNSPTTAEAASAAARRGTGWASRTRLVEQVRKTQSRLSVGRSSRASTPSSR